MNERTQVLLANAIDYIQEKTGFTNESIAKELLGMTEKEWKEIKHKFEEE